MKTTVNIALTVIALLGTTFAHAVDLPGPLVETDWLAKNSKDVVILDIRADVKSFTKKPVFVKDKKSGKQFLVGVGGHIPGAVLVNYKKIRAKRKIDGNEVDKLIPEKAVFEKLMQQAGLNQDGVVVITSKGESNGDMTMATRLYWQLKYFGHDNLAILNGGIAQWILDGHQVASGPGKTAAGNWQAGAGRSEILATSDDVARAVKDGKVQLVDNRPLSQYLGTTKRSYVYAKGHIPGAKLYPNELMNQAGMPAKFLPNDDLRKLHTELGVKADQGAITYCNSGHLASGGWFIMSELLGNKDVKLYDGSMHQWTLEKHPVRAMKME